MTTAMPERVLEAEHSLSGLCFFLRLPRAGARCKAHSKAKARRLPVIVAKSAYI